MTRTFVILLVVTALLFIGFYFVVTLYNRFVGGFVPAGPLLPETFFIENFIRLPFGP